jgi:DNA invertase Pin-like site-specific DNA recombinase
MTRYPAAYLRRSSATGDNPGDASREAQEAAVRRLCGDDVTLYVDWGISGRKADRPDYVRLKADIADGKVASVCAYSLSRLGRNARELLAFIELAQKHDVPVRTAVESIDTSTAMGRAMLTVMAAFAQLEVEQGMERSAAARAAREVRHHDAGVAMPGGLPVYGRRHVTIDGITRVEPDPERPVGPILAAYREAGSILGACRLLMEAGVPAPHGGTRWGTSSLTRIIEAHAPEMLPRRNQIGQRQPARAILAQLVRCPFCGQLLTPNTTRRQLYCSHGSTDRSAHPRYVASERAVLAFVVAEVAHLAIPGDAVALEAQIAARRDAIETRLNRAHELYIGGSIEKVRYEREADAVRRELDALTAQESTINLPPVDEISAALEDPQRDPGKLNRLLRALFTSVELDARMAPLAVVWTVPEWRQP